MTLILFTLKSVNVDVLPSSKYVFEDLIKMCMRVIKKDCFHFAITSKVPFNCHSAIGISEAVKFNEPHSGQGFRLHRHRRHFSLNFASRILEYG